MPEEFRVAENIVGLIYNGMSYWSHIEIIVTEYVLPEGHILIFWPEIMREQNREVSYLHEDSQL